MQLYQVCEDLTELLVYLMVVFSPWAFGSTQHWSVWVMNGAGYCLGGLLAVKLAIRRLKGYHPPRWEEGGKSEVRSQKSAIRNPQSAIRNPQSQGGGQSSVISNQWGAALAGLTVAILAYCLISALNASATYQPATRRFDYHDNYVPWLPHSLDSRSTWFAFWTYLGLACSFWAVRDWLLGKSAPEARAERQPSGPSAKAQPPIFPARLRRLFWLLAINGGLLGLEGIIQRLEGSGKLLFLVRPRIHKTAATQFGPYAYYANASQYFNLLWPACLGFWWRLQRSQAGGLRHYLRHYLVLLCCAIMAACPIISTCRGGTFITVGLLVLTTLYLAATQFQLHPPSRDRTRKRNITLGILALFFTGALALGCSLGWKALKPRLATTQEDLRHREEMYDVSRPMAADHPVFGIGPGAWESVSEQYRVPTMTDWPAQVHNDWLETRITFGWVGSALIALAFATVVLRWFVRGGIHGGRRFVLLTWLGLGGCLLHARFDFPFQIHSIVFLFLLLCAILFNLTRHSKC